MEEARFATGVFVIAVIVLFLATIILHNLFSRVRRSLSSGQPTKDQLPNSDMIAEQG